MKELQEYERRLHSTRLPGEQIADAYLNWMQQRADGEASAVLAAETGGRFAGFVAGWIKQEHSITETAEANRFGYISDLCVLPTYGGRRIATQLLNAIEQHLRHAGVGRIQIGVLAANGSARASYEHAGFKAYEVVYEKIRPHADRRSMAFDFAITELDEGRGDVARAILEALPEWFGLPDARETYINSAMRLPMIVARTQAGEAVGFLSLKRHTLTAAEAYVLGVRREHHRRGCGRALCDAAERRLAAEGVRYLTVKTLAPSDPDPNYAATRRFYQAIGFEPIEVFPTLWDEDNPCLLMLKRIA